MNLPDISGPVIVALIGILGLTVQAFLSRREREERLKREGTEEENIAMKTLRQDYDRIKQERDKCYEEVAYLRNLLRRNGYKGERKNG